MTRNGEFRHQCALLGYWVTNNLFPTSVGINTFITIMLRALTTSYDGRALLITQGTHICLILWQSVCTACALRVHCVRTAWALRAHCVHIAVKPTPCHLCITLQSNKANKTHIEPLPTRYFDVLVNISFSDVEYHYAVETIVTLVSAIVINYFILKELSVHSRRTTLIPNRNIRRLSRHKISCPYYIPKVVHGHRYLINMACVLGI